MIRSLLASSVLAVCGITAEASAVAAAAAPIPTPPTLPARAYLLEDYQTSRVLASDHADDRMEPASLTKLMTAYIIFTNLHDGRLKLTDQVTISEHAWRSEGSRTFIQVGTQIPVDILIKGMIVQSGNDATVALAERVAGTEERLRAGHERVRQTLRHGAHALHECGGAAQSGSLHHARDLSLLAHRLIADFPDFYPLFSLHEFTWNNIKQQNRNGLLSADPTVDGLKTGHTDSAGYCLVTSSLRNHMRLISVVLGSSSIKEREQASATLLGYGFSFYQTVLVKNRGEVIATPRVFLSDTNTAPVGLAQDVVVTVGRDQVTVGRDQTGQIKSTPTIDNRLLAPLAAGAKVGNLVVTTPDGVVVANVPIVTLHAVPEGGLWTRMNRSHLTLVQIGA